MFVSWFYAVCVLILLNSENKKPSIQLPDTHLLISESGGQSLSSHTQHPQSVVFRLCESRPE